MSDNALRHGNHFAHEFLGFFEVLEITEGIRVIAGCLEGEPMFSAIKPSNILSILPSADAGIFVWQSAYVVA